MFDSKEIAQRALLRAKEIKMEKAEKKRRINGICLGISMLVMVLAAIPGMLLPSSQIEDDPVPLAASLFADESAVAYTEIDMKVFWKLGIPGYDCVTIPADVSEVTMTLFNPEGNPYWFAFEIFLDDTGETLYTSGLVAPSMGIEKITLEKQLEAGVYPATVAIRFYEMNSLAAMGKASMDFTIIAR